METSPSIRPNLHRTIRVAVVGAGKMAANHVRAIGRCNPAVDVVALADPSAEALGQLAVVAPGAKHYSSLTPLLAAERVDVVHVCTPPALHSAIAMEALEAGCHVYVEKPFAKTTTEADRILNLARAKRLMVAAGHQLLYERPTRIVGALLPTIGRISHIESYFSFRTVRRAPGGRVPLAADLQLLDILPHPVYLLLHFLSLGSQGSPELLALDAGEAGTVHALVKQGNLTASLVVTLQGRPVESYVRLVGTNGSLFADYIRGTVQRQIGPGSSGIDKVLSPYRLAGQLLGGTTSALSARVLNRQANYPGLVELFEAFYGAIRTGSAPPVSEENIRETTRICEQVDASLQSNGHGPILLEDKPMKDGVLVTGGTGLLGRAVVRELLSRQRAVRVIARREPAAWERVAGAEYAVADLSRSLPPSFLAGITSVVHAAAETAGGWREHEKNSIDATDHILVAAAAAGVARVIHVSSLAVLQKPSRGEPISDDDKLLGDSRRYGPYIWGKLESERRAVELANQLRLPLKVVRPGPLVDSDNFEPPGRLGRRIGNFYVAVGAPGDRLAMTDVGFAARVLSWMIESFDRVPAVVNLLNPVLPAKREAIAQLRIMNPDITVIWLPRAVLVPLSWMALMVQKAVRPRKPAMNIAQAFASPRYDTSRISEIAAHVNDYARIATPVPKTAHELAGIL